MLGLERNVASGLARNVKQDKSRVNVWQTKGLCVCNDV